MKKVLTWIKPLMKPLLALALVVALFFSNADAALAARGGRIGGGSFSRPAPTRAYRAPTTRTSPPGGGGYYPGGGFGFPFLIPIFGVGGGFGGLFSILIFIAIANFIVSAFRRSQEDREFEAVTNPSVTVSRLQVGLLAQARELQADLNRIALAAKTNSSEGLAQVLQETTLSLLRHPEYWVYASSDTQKSYLSSAELEFNRMALAERSKFNEETLSNVNNQLRQASDRPALEGSGELAIADQQPGEYIVVTILAASEGKQELPAVNSSESLRRALSQLGAIPSDQLLALEVLWTPQADTDTLSSDEVIALYPNLKLV
jgi:uncharacterized membrane protein